MLRWQSFQGFGDLASIQLGSLAWTPKTELHCLGLLRWENWVPAFRRPVYSIAPLESKKIRGSRSVGPDQVEVSMRNTLNAPSALLTSCERAH